MDKHLMFRDTIRGYSHSHTYSHTIVSALVGEIIRLKVQHEGLIDPDENQQNDSADKTIGEVKPGIDKDVCLSLADRLFRYRR